MRSVRGFTLIEILVVLTIVGVMVGGALLSLGVVGVDRRHVEDAERLQALLGYLRDRAELEGRGYGVELDRDGYRVWRFEPRQRTWIPASETTMQPRRWRSEIPIELRLDGRLVQLDGPRASSKDARQRTAQPQLGVDALGEFTVFSVRFSGPPATEAFELAPDAEGELQLTGEVRR